MNALGSTDAAAGGAGTRRQPLRILVVSHHFWPESFRINQVVEDLIAQGAEVTVLTGNPGYPSGSTYPGYASHQLRTERHPSGFDIYRVPVVHRGRGNAWRLILNYLSFILSGGLLGAFMLRGRSFDTVFVYCTTPVIQGYLGLWLGLLKRAKVVLWIQDLWPQALSALGFVKSRFLLRAVETMVSAMYRASDLVLGQSHAFATHIAPQAGRVPVRYFPNPGEHQMPAGEPGAGPSGAGFDIVFAGNLGNAQGLDMVVDAAELLRDDPEIRFVLYGSGVAAARIADAIRERGLDNVILPGRVPPEAMPDVYAKASALLLTLIDDPVLAQTVPSKLQSYLAAGRPIIAAVNGEAARIVAEAGAGIASPAEDASALAYAIRRLKAMPEAERGTMSAAAMRYFKAHYEPRMLARQLLDMMGGLALPCAQQGRTGPRELW